MWWGWYWGWGVRAPAERRSRGRPGGGCGRSGRGRPAGAAVRRDTTPDLITQDRARSAAARTRHHVAADAAEESPDNVVLANAAAVAEDAAVATCFVALGAPEVTVIAPVV